MGLWSNFENMALTISIIKYCNMDWSDVKKLEFPYILLQTSVGRELIFLQGTFSLAIQYNAPDILIYHSIYW